MGLVGHYEQSRIDFSSPHFTNYQKPKALQVLKSAMDELNYDIQFSALRTRALRSKQFESTNPRATHPDQTIHD